MSNSALMILTNRRLLRGVLALTLGVSALTALSGCGLLLVGGAVGGAMSIADRRTTGAQTEDAGIELKGGSRMSSVFGDTVRIYVTSYNRKVLLTGEVKDEATRLKAENEIRGVENVQSVVNEIQIVTFLPSFSERSKDVYLTSRVRAQLVGTRDIYSSSFKIETESGIVYLMGRVSQREGNTAAEAVRTVSGVIKVIKVFEYIDEDEVKKYQAKPPPADPASNAN